MFCPVGFRSASELWDEFLAARFESTYADVTQGYRRVNFIASLTRGSPIDVCEHIFLKSLAAVGIHVASPEGQVMKLHVRMEDDQPNLFSSSGIYRSALYCAAVEIDSNNLESQEIIDESVFESWDGEASDNVRLAETYPLVADVDERKKKKLGWNVRHHSLLHHIRRQSFTITGSVPMWATDTAGASQVAPILAHYSGWAVCLDQDTCDNRWQDYHAGKIELYPTDVSDATVSQTGRPRLSAAFDAFAAMNFEKGELSWEQVGRKIERESGHKPSAKSLRNWRNEAKITD